jgi:hypothetical protein
MHALSQNSQNWLAVKFDLRSVMMVFGKPKRCRMSEMKSTTLSGMSLVISLYSIHLVNLSIATNTWVKPPGAVVNGPIKSRLQQANDHDVDMVIRLWAGMWGCLPKKWQFWNLRTRSSASDTAVGHQKPALYAFPTNILEAACLLHTPSCISYSMSWPSSPMTHFMSTPDRAPRR